MARFPQAFGLVNKNQFINYSATINDCRIKAWLKSVNCHQNCYRLWTNHITSLVFQFFSLVLFSRHSWRMRWNYCDITAQWCAQMVRSVDNCTLTRCEISRAWSHSTHDAQLPPACFNHVRTQAESYNFFWLCTLSSSSKFRPWSKRCRIRSTEAERSGTLLMTD